MSFSENEHPDSESFEVTMALLYLKTYYVINLSLESASFISMIFKCFYFFQTGQLREFSIASRSRTSTSVFD